MAEFFLETDMTPKGDQAEAIKKLVDKYVEISKEASELTKEKDSIKDILIEYASEKNFEQLY